MKVLIWLLVSVFSYGQSLAEAYNIFEENGKIGLKDTNGQVLIPPAYDALGWSEGPFSVVGQVTGYKSAGRWGIIDLTNHEVTEAEFTGLLPGEGNFIIAYKRSGGSSRYLAGCLDTSGKEVIPFQYDGLTINSLRGIVYVRSGNQYKYGLIDLHNRPIIPIEYKQIQFLGSNRYAVEDHTGQFALFSESGKPLTGFIFDDISRFRNNYALVYQQQYQGIIDQNGLLRINPSFTSIELNDDGTARGRREHQWTILNAGNEKLRQLQFDSIISLGNNLFGIRKGAGYALADDQFNVLGSEKFSSIASFENDRAIISHNGRYGMISNDGRILIEPGYLSLRQEAGVVIARLPADQWILLDPGGKRLSGKSYAQIEPYHGEYFIVRNSRHSGVMNRGGKEIISCVYDSILQYAYGKIVVQFHGEFGIIDLAGNWLVPPSPQRQMLIATDRYIQRKDSTCYLKSVDGDVIYFTKNPLKVAGGFLEETTSAGGVWKIDMDGRIVSRQLPPAGAFEEIFSETEGLRGIRKDGRFGFVDNLGRLRIANRYEGIKPFHEGLAAIKILGKWGFLNHDEKLVIQPVHDEVSSFDNGMAIVMQDDSYGLIDKKGEVVLPIRYEAISTLPSGRFELKNGKLTGLADRDGRLIFAPKFTAITDLDNGYVIISRDGKCGLATVNALSTIPMIYDYILYDQYGDRYLALKESQWEDIKK